MAADDTPLEAVLKRDRLLVGAGLVGVTALCWIYLAILAADMTGASGLSLGETMAEMGIRPWTAGDFVLMVLMWAVMMVGMMLPSAAPMILLFARVSRNSRGREGPAPPAVGAFVSGYAIVWSVFSLGATVLQWAFEQAALLSPMMVSTSPVLGGALLIAAGIYQWTPVKDVCLAHCQTPFVFISQHWRRGTWGALRMGVEHGAFCVGCCWLLMGLLFFGGVMNLLWIAAISVFVLVEKVAPLGRQSGRLTGIVLVGAGTYVVMQGWGA